MQNDVAGPDGSALSEGLGLAPERAGQPRMMTIIDGAQEDETGHWYSPAAVREMLAAERDRCATRAWVHYMDVCKVRRLPPSEQEHWNAARAVRSQTIDDDPMPYGHADISDDDPGPNVAGNRLARQGQSELTGVLGGRLRTDKD